jgi:hypothetical protein
MRVLFGWLLVFDIRIVSPLPARCRYSAQLEGADNLLVASSRNTASRRSPRGPPAAIPTP